jgi:hypothetical protein
LSERPDPTPSLPSKTMEELRLFFNLPEPLRPIQAELARLEEQLAANDDLPPLFTLEQKDLDNLFMLEERQWLEPEGRVRSLAPMRWLYTLVRRLFLGTQRRYNESVTHLLRRLSAVALLTRYHQMRALALERRLEQLEARLARLEAERPARRPPSPPPEPKP